MLEATFFSAVTRLGMQPKKDFTQTQNFEFFNNRLKDSDCT